MGGGPLASRLSRSLKVIGTSTNRLVRAHSAVNDNYPRRARSALGVDTVLTLDVCMFVCMYVRALERKRLIGMT